MKPSDIPESVVWNLHRRESDSRAPLFRRRRTDFLSLSETWKPYLSFLFYNFLHFLTDISFSFLSCSWHNFRHFDISFSLMYFFTFLMFRTIPVLHFHFIFLYFIILRKIHNEVPKKRIYKSCRSEVNIS